jgi:hypothetical protein
MKSSLYDCDFYEWTQNIAEDLRQGRVAASDVERVAEEIADMGKRDRRELRSRMVVLLIHLMKWATQPERRRASTWRATINKQRDQVEGILEDSPSLRADLNRQAPILYVRAAKRAASETDLPLATFLPDAFRGRVPDTGRVLSGEFFPEILDDLFS